MKICESSSKMSSEIDATQDSTDDNNIVNASSVMINSENTFQTLHFDQLEERNEVIEISCGSVKSLHSEVTQSDLLSDEKSVNSVENNQSQQASISESIETGFNSHTSYLFTELQYRKKYTTLELTPGCKPVRTKKKLCLTFNLHFKTNIGFIYIRVHNTWKEFSCVGKSPVGNIVPSLYYLSYSKPSQRANW